MSSILKALKQLESESDSQSPATGLPGAWRDRPAAGTPPAAKLKNRNLRRIFAAGIGVGMVCLTGIFLLSRPANQQPQSGPVGYRITAPVPPPPAPETSATPQSSPKGPEAAPKLASRRPAPPELPPPAAPQRKPDRREIAPAARPAPPEPAPPQSQGAEPPEARRTISSAPPAQRRPAAGSATARPLRPKSVAEPAMPSAPERSDPRISVQAIAWAQEPTQRMAVVNGNIVQEGEAVEGIQIKTIEKDGIVFTEGGRWWKQGP